MISRASFLAVLVAFPACSSPGNAAVDAGTDTGPGPGIDAARDGAIADCGTPAECAAIWETNAANLFDAVLTDPTALATFLKAVPKGGDLHNHLSGAVYAETYLGWAATDGNCINSTSFSAVNTCNGSTQPVPASGAFFDQIVRAWSMKDFVAGTQNGHDHFFATFAKYGLVAGAHRDDTIADVLTRAADENQVYVETMFNLGKNVGTLAASVWSGAVTAGDFPALYNMLLANPTFAAQVAADAAVVNSAEAGYKATLDCDGLGSTEACNVGVRFIAQVSRTGANDQLFGQLVSAYEMAKVAPMIVGANLSSPEDDTAAINNYELHMAMLDFLHTKYTATGASPLHITLHAGEVVPQYLPPGSNANTFHIQRAVEVGHAERIGHGIDVLSETEPSELMAMMAARNVLVEVCLSSNIQILEVSGTAHPLAQYLAAGVPVALATDDQGVSRSSMAGEYARAALDQNIGYRQLKTMARNSLEHAFVPGASLWTAVATGVPVAACASTDTMGIGDPPSAGCQEFLDTSERARFQWELERRFRAFESAQ